MRTSKITTALAVAALVVAVLGTTPLGHAAGSILPRGSVGTPQLKRNAVTGAKVLNGTLTAADFKAGSLAAATATVPAARVTRGSSNQTVANNNLTYVTFDSETFDTAGLFSPGAQGLKAPVAGLYLVTASVRWRSNPTGTRFAAFELATAPGYYIAPDWRNAASDGATTDQEITTLISLQADQVVRLRVYQTSGSPVDLLWRDDPDSKAQAPVLTMHRIGPAS